PVPAREDPVRLASMPMIMKSPHHDPILLDKRHLVFEERIVAQIHSDVIGTPESGLMADDERISSGGRTLQQAQSPHERAGDPGDRLVRISHLKCVGGVTCPPWKTQVLSNPLDHFTGRNLPALGA